MKRAPTVFNKIEFDTFKPLVIIHESGRGMFSKRASKELFIIGGVKDNDRIRLFFDPKTNLPGGSEKAKGYVVKVEDVNNMYYFKSKAIVEQLNTRFPRQYYCSEMNIYPRVYFYRGVHITMWELYNTHDLTLGLELKSTHLERQKKRAIKIKDELISFLKVDEETYNIWIFETAFKFLERLLGDDTWSIEKLTQHDPFWRWWKNQFNIENERLLYTFKDIKVSNIELLRELFQMEHINVNRYLESNLYQYLYNEKEKVRKREAKQLLKYKRSKS